MDRAQGAGQAALAQPAKRAALARVIEDGPVPAIDGVVRWRLVDLAQWVFETFRISISRQTLGRELRAMNYRKLSARPRHHAQAAGAVEDLKTFPAVVAAVARTRGLDPSDIEIWFGDEARIGQKNKTTRRWAPRGTRPSAPHDQRTASTYVFGAICPAEGKAAGLVLPWCNTEAMTLHLAEISAHVAPGRHAVLVVDQAGWHMSAGLDVPSNITVVPLPAKCPELQRELANSTR